MAGEIDGPPAEPTPHSIAHHRVPPIIKWWYTGKMRARALAARATSAGAACSANDSDRMTNAYGQRTHFYVKCLAGGALPCFTLRDQARFDQALCDAWHGLGPEGLLSEAAREKFESMADLVAATNVLARASAAAILAVFGVEMAGFDFALFTFGTKPLPLLFAVHSVGRPGEDFAPKPRTQPLSEPPDADQPAPPSPIADLLPVEEPPPEEPPAAAPAPSILVAIAAASPRERGPWHRCFEVTFPAETEARGLRLVIDDEVGNVERAALCVERRTLRHQSWSCGVCKRQPRTTSLCWRPGRRRSASSTP